MAILVTLDFGDDFEGWAAQVRALMRAGIPAREVCWRVGLEGASDLFAQPFDPASLPAQSRRDPTVPRRFRSLAGQVILHCEPERFVLLHRLVERLQTEPGLLEDAADPLVRRLTMMARQVGRDIHKMQAFVRFREIDDHYVAWFEPEHLIERANAGFFVRRFAAMRWSILTPRLSLHWDGETVQEGPGGDRSPFPDADPVEAVWRTYYSAIFNPARLKVGAMLREMPKRYWRNLPEASLIGGLIAGAQAREATMVAQVAAPERRASSLAMLAEEALACRRCPLADHATRTVNGEGPANAKLMIIGEQPGDSEDLAGRPFVGPAGQMLMAAMADAGVERSTTFMTNAVKHFKFEQRGKLRMHASPNRTEVEMCRWWVEQEISILRPRAILLLGRTAARSILGMTPTMEQSEGVVYERDGIPVLLAPHPSYLLRVPDEERRKRGYQRLVGDLVRAAALADQPDR